MQDHRGLVRNDLGAVPESQRRLVNRDDPTAGQLHALQGRFTRGPRKATRAEHCQAPEISLGQFTDVLYTGIDHVLSQFRGLFHLGTVGREDRKARHQQ